MRKIIFAFMIVFCSIFSLSADIIKVGDDKEMHFSIGPYNGSYNIDMRADYYPQYVNGQNVPNWEFATKPMHSTDTDKYWDSQMIAAVTMYNIPKTVQHEGKSYSIKDSDSVHIKVSVDCANGFYFNSQSNPSIIRPFNLYGKTVYVKQTGYMDGSQSFGSTAMTSYDNKLIFLTPPYDNSWTTDTIGSIFTSDYNAFWMDLIISLPFDEGGISRTGVMVGGAQYPLIDANDYTALVSVTGELSITYVASDGDIYEFSYTKSLSIPFSGYSNAIVGYEEDKTSIYINTSTANINLNREYTGRWIDIGSIDFMQNFLYSNGVKQPSASEGKAVSRIFFSASSDPFTQNADGFRFVHRNAGNVLTSNNSVRFSLRFEGTGDSADQGNKYFDGKGYTSSADMMDGIVGEYITSHCDNNEYVLHTEYNKRRLHYHSIQGDLSILVDDNPDTMQVGSYFADVYVHIIANDLL